MNMTYFRAYAICLVIIAVFAIYGIPINSPLAIVRLLIGIPIFIFFPGYLLVKSVYSNTEDFIEQLALSISFSLALVSLTGILQYFIAGKIELLRTLLLFAVLTIIFIFVTCKVSKSSSGNIMQEKREKQKIFLVYITFLGIILIHIFQLLYIINQTTSLAGTDYANWLAHAYTFKTGSLFIFWNEDSGYPPLSISLIAIMGYLFDDDLLALKFLILLTSSLFILVSYILGKVLTGSYLTGLVAGAISTSFPLSLNTIAWGGYPTFLSYIYGGLTAFFLLRLIERQNATSSNIIGAGLNIGFLILVHHVSFLTHATVFLSFFILSFILKKAIRKQLTKAYVSIGFIGLAIASPYIYHILLKDTHLKYYLQSKPAYFHHIERVQIQNLFHFIDYINVLLIIFSILVLVITRMNVNKGKIAFLLVWLLIPILLTRIYLIGLITDYLRFFYFVSQPIILFISVAYYALCSALVKAENKVKSNQRIPLSLTTTHRLKIASLIILLMLMSTLIVIAISVNYSRFKDDYNWFLSIRQPEYEAITWLKNYSSPLDVVVAPHELALWTRGLAHVRVLEDTPEEYVFYSIQLDRIRASSLILHADYEIRNGFIRMRLQENKGWLFNPLIEVFDYDPTVTSYRYVPLLYLQDYWTYIVLSSGKTIRLTSFSQSYVEWVMREKERASLQQVYSYGKSNAVRNLIINSGFENGTWGGKEVLDSSYVWEGRYSAKLVASHEYVASGLSNAIPTKILAGETFTVSAMVNALVSKGSLYLRIHYYDSNNRVITHWDWAVIKNSTNGWRLITMVFTPDHPFHPSNVNGTNHIYFDFAWWDPTGSPSGIAFIDSYKCELGLVVTKTLTITKFEPILRVDINVTPSEAAKEVIIGGFSFYEYHFSRYDQQGLILTLIGRRNASMIMSSNFINSSVLLVHPEYRQTFYSLRFNGSNASITLRLYPKGWVEDIYTADIYELLMKYKVSYVMIYNHTKYWVTLRFLNRVDLFTLVYWNDNILIFKVKK
jgi:hypothetical protein